MYFDPAVNQAKSDGLGALGQFIYYDAIVMHGPGTSTDSFGGTATPRCRRRNHPPRAVTKPRISKRFSTRAR